MPSKLNPYLNFNGNARQVMEFYKGVFGGNLTLSTFKEANMSSDPSDDNLVMHSQLDVPNGILLMGSDVPKHMGVVTPGSDCRDRPAPRAGDLACGHCRPRPQPTDHRHDLVAGARNRPRCNGAAAFVAREVVVRDGGLRRPLIRGPVNPEPRGETMQLVDVVGEQVRPLQAVPFPDRLVDVNRHGKKAAQT